MNLARVVDRLPEMLELVEVGMSRRKIAAKLGLNKNSVCRVLWEHNNKKKPLTSLLKKIRDIVATTPAEAREGVPRDLASNVDKYLYHKDDAVRGISIMELTDNSCRWLISENYAGECYCGRPKFRRSYCAQHARVAFDGRWSCS